MDSAIFRGRTVLAAAVLVLLCGTATVAQRIQFSSPLPDGYQGGSSAGNTGAPAAGSAWTSASPGTAGAATSGQTAGIAGSGSNAAPIYPPASSGYPPANSGGSTWYGAAAPPGTVGGAPVGAPGGPAMSTFVPPSGGTSPAGSGITSSPAGIPSTPGGTMPSQSGIPSGPPGLPQSAPTAPGWSSGVGSGAVAPWSGPVPSYPPNYYGAPPSSTLDGQVQPAGPMWDPYQPPGTTPATLLPQDPSFQLGSGQWAGTMQKFLQEVRLDYLWMPGSGATEIGMNDIGLSATFALPLFYNAQTPLLVTPGFMIHCWSGPETLLGPPPPADLPGQTYDAYLDAAWNPQPTPTFGAELNFRIGVGADFKKVTTRSLRFTGKGLAVLNLSPSFQLKGGMIYYDRVHLKLLPAGGVVWTPTQDWRFDIVFPYPRITKRLNSVGTTEWWLYFAGSYPNGGAWTIKRADEADPAIAGQIDLVDYTDMRVAAGLEFKAINNVRGFVESGVAFERQLHYRSDLPDVFYANVSVFLHAGLAY